MTPSRLILAGLRLHARAHLAVALGVMTATAVVTGALVVGDSVRGSLRGLTFERLGRVDHALVAPGFFRQELAAELRTAFGERGPTAQYADALPVLLLPGSATRAD